MEKLAHLTTSGRARSAAYVTAHFSTYVGNNLDFRIAFLFYVFVSADF